MLGAAGLAVAFGLTKEFSIIFIVCLAQGVRTVVSIVVQRLDCTVRAVALNFTAKLDEQVYIIACVQSIDGEDREILAPVGASVRLIEVAPASSV